MYEFTKGRDTRFRANLVQARRLRGPAGVPRGGALLPDEAEFGTSWYDECMTNIRLRLDLSGVGLEFSGSQAFYDRWVQPLVEATCQRSMGARNASAPGGTPPSDGNGAAGTVQDAPPSTGLPSTGSPSSGPLAEAPARATTGSDASTGSVFRPESPARFQQFVAQVGDRAATTERQIMAFGFYLWNYEKREAFSSDDLQGFFAMLHQDAPEDEAAVLGVLMNRKRFLEADGDDGWKLTTKGVNYVKNRLLGTV